MGQAGAPRSCSKFVNPAFCSPEKAASSMKPSKRDQSQQQKWPLDALQVVEEQISLLRAHTLSLCGNQMDPDSIKPFQEEQILKNRKNKEGPFVDLPAQPALPHGWEQFLDLNTGEVYYIDWSIGKRTSRDPREMLKSAEDSIRTRLRGQFEAASGQEDLMKQKQNKSLKHATGSNFEEDLSCSSVSSIAHSNCDFVEINSPFYDYSCSVYCESSGMTDDTCSVSESTSSTNLSESDDNTMVAVGCCNCLRYFMLPRLDPECPNCGAALQISNSYGVVL